MSDPASILLNFNTPFSPEKVQILEQVISAMYKGNSQEVSENP